jgi:hypothetical protein
MIRYVSYIAMVSVAVSLVRAVILYEIHGTVDVSSIVRYTIYLFILFSILSVAVNAVSFMLDLSDTISGKASYLSAAVFDVVKQVESCSASGWKANSKLYDDTVAKFSIHGSSEIVSKTKTIASYNVVSPVDKLSEVGVDVAKLTADARVSFLRGRSLLRENISILVLLLWDNNIGSAYVYLTEYMIRQVGDKNIPNLTYIKKFFGVNVDRPDDGYPQLLSRNGLSFFDFYVLGKSIDLWRNTKTKTLSLRIPSPGGKPDITVTGDDVIVCLRKFLSSSLEDLYDEKYNCNHQNAPR